MIPTGSWSCESKPKVFRTYPKPLPEQRYGSAYDVKIGPVNLSESNGRLDSRYWLVYQLADKVVIRGAIDDNTWSEPTELFTELATITAISLSFDNLGRPVLAYQKNGGVYLWFYDSQLGDATIKTISTVGLTPVVDFDIKEDTSSVDADIMLYYVKEDSIYYRLQRDRFDVEYYTGVSEPNVKLRRAGVTSDNRFQVEYTYDDLRNGTNLQRKCLETTLPVLTNIQGNNFEVGFTIAKAPTICELRKLYSTYGIGWNGRFCLVSHAGNHTVTGHPNEEHLFTLEFMYDNIEQDGSSIFLILKRTPFSLGEYFTVTLGSAALGAGSYRLVFEQAAPVLGQAKKRITLYKNNTAIVDQTVDDLSSVVSNTPSTRNRLRFGASVEYNTSEKTEYKFLYPATFTNIYTVVNSSRIDWFKDIGDLEVESSPVGNTMYLRRDGDPSYVFRGGTGSV